MLGFAALLTASGCVSTPDTGGGSGGVVAVPGARSTTFIVFGFGIVTVPKPSGTTAVLAVKSTAVGIQLSDQPGAKVSVGFSTGATVAVPSGASDVRVEISHRDGASIVNVKSTDVPEPSPPSSSQP